MASGGWKQISWVSVSWCIGLYYRFFHGGNGMEKTKGKRPDVQFWCGNVLESLVEFSQARVIWFNWQRSELPSARRQRCALWISNASCWRCPTSVLRIFIFLWWRHELDGTSIYHAVWLSKGNRYKSLPPPFTMFTTKQHLWFRKLSANLVQAALGPVALDLARSQKVINEEQFSLAQNVLVISVLAIILTAPLGKWLNRDIPLSKTDKLQFYSFPRRFTYDKISSKVAETSKSDRWNVIAAIKENLKLAHLPRNLKSEQQNLLT